LVARHNLKHLHRHRYQLLTSQLRVSLEALDWLKKLKLKLIYDRQSVGHPSGTSDQFFFLPEIFFRQLWACYCVAPSLTRGRVCNLLVQLLLGLDRAVTLGSKSSKAHGHTLMSHLRLPNLEGQVPLFISPRDRVAQLYSRGMTEAGETGHVYNLGMDRTENTAQQLFYLCVFIAIKPLLIVSHRLATCMFTEL
jgi:hypothetical protein